jgi:UDP-GlcNAc:undecaprenyl-phosphate GlcNAc-1-phosphate transferase
VTNAINLIDGLDGLAGGVCVIVCLSLFFIAKDLGNLPLAATAFVLAAAIAGFLIFNFAPARLFLGDSGALFLGFMLAALTLAGTAKRSTLIVLIGPPLVLALPVVDTLLAIVRRFLKKAATGEDLSGYRLYFRPSQLLVRLKEVFRADQQHIHHGLLAVGLSHRRAVLILYGVTAALGLAAYQMSVKQHIGVTVALLSGTGLVLVSILRRAKRRSS